MQTQKAELVLEIMTWGERLALLVLFVVALVCLWRGSRLVRRLGEAGANETILYRKHWGGFGGDSSGWQVSAPLASMILGVVLIALGVSLATGMVFVLHQHEIAKPAGDDKAGSANKSVNANNPGSAITLGTPTTPPKPDESGKGEQEEEPPRAPAPRK